MCSSDLGNDRDRLGYGSNLNPRLRNSNPTNIVINSGASLASDVTATSFFMEETHGVEDQHVVRGIDGDDEDEDEDARSNDGDDEGDGGDTFDGDGSASSE